MNKRDAHGNPVTAERRRFQSAVARRAFDEGYPGHKVAAYSPGDEVTTALLRERPAKPAPVADWPRHRFHSQVLERGIRRALNPTESPDLPMDTRTRIAQASWSSSDGRMALDDCYALIEISLYSRKGDKT